MSMMAGQTSEYESKSRPRLIENDTPLTPAQQAEFDAKYDAYGRLMAGREGRKRRFRGVVLKFSEQQEVPNTFPGTPPGTMKKVRDFVVELTEPGLEGCRFYGTTGDNPFNDKTLLNHLIVAVEGEAPPKYGKYNVDWEKLTTTEVWVELTKKKPRNDGKYGGFWTKVSDFETIYDDELPAVAAVAVPAPAPTKRKAAAPTSIVVAEDDDLPFEDAA